MDCTCWPLQLKVIPPSWCQELGLEKPLFVRSKLIPSPNLLSCSSKYRSSKLSTTLVWKDLELKNSAVWTSYTFSPRLCHLHQTSVHKIPNRSTCFLEGVLRRWEVLSVSLFRIGIFRSPWIWNPHEHKEHAWEKTVHWRGQFRSHDMRTRQANRFLVSSRSENWFQLHL